MNWAKPRVCSLLGAGLISLVALTTACGGGGTEPSETRMITDFFSGATTVGTTQVAATTRSGAPPAPASGPTATLASPAQATSGTPSLVQISGSAPFQTIYVSIGSAQSARASSPSFLHAWAGRWVRLFEADLTAASIGTSGFLQIDLSAPVTDVSHRELRTVAFRNQLRSADSDHRARRCRWPCRIGAQNGNRSWIDRDSGRRLRREDDQPDGARLLRQPGVGRDSVDIA